MANSLTQAYLDLPQDERDAALASLIRAVAKDRHSLQLVKNTISDACDPFNRLPVELFFHIFDHLHPFDVWSLRRTCQRWNEQLSSAQMMRDAVNRFATEHPSDSALDMNTATPPSLALELRHILALRLARPFTHVSLPGSPGASQPSIATQQRTSAFQLKGRCVAYIRSLSGHEDRSVVVRDLISGETALLRGEAREYIMNVALSTELVAFATYAGVLYVASLKDLTAPPSPVRLPSSYVVAIAAGRGTVACVLRGSQPVVVIHRIATRKSTSFNLRAAQISERLTDPNTHLRVRAISINEDRETIDIAAVVSPRGQGRIEETDLCVIVSRFNFAGEYVTQVAWEQQIPEISGLTASLGPFGATGERGLHSMELTYSYSRSRSGTRSVHEVQNADTVVSAPRESVVAGITLLYDEVEVSLKPVDQTFSTPRTALLNPNLRPLLWKDRLYRAAPRTGPMAAFQAASRSSAPQGTSYDGPHILRTLDGQFTRDLDDGRLEAELNDEPLYVDSRLRPQGVQIRPSGRRVAYHEMIAINDSFVVTVGSDDIEVACFDERVKLYGAESTKLWDPDHEHPYSLPSLA